jgi:ribonuclease HI
MSKLEIYTDGSCRSNTGKGGWGVVIIQDDTVIQKLSGSQERTTNNRMELLAAIEALKWICSEGRKDDLVFFTDSTYLSRGMTEWTKGWKKRQWKMANGQAMKNADLWQSLDALASPLKIRWKWVKAHNGNKYNEMADGLAQEASLPPQ